MWCDIANALTCRHTTAPSQFSFVSHIQVHCSIVPLKLKRSNLPCDKNITSPIFDVQRAVHHNIISTVNPTRRTNVSNLFILEWHFICVGWSSCPSSGVQDCTYSNRHLSESSIWQADSSQHYLFDKCLLLYAQS